MPFGSGGEFATTHGAATGAEGPQGPQGAGGGGGGSPVVRAFPFAFDTPNLLTGADVYVPTIGDILLDAWVEIDTVWDGTTPQGDIGTFVGNIVGLFGYWVSDGAIPLDLNPSQEAQGAGLSAFGPSSLAQIAATSSARSLWQTAAIPATPNPAALFTSRHASESMQQCQTGIGKFTAANPIKVVVSQDGTNTGADPGSTHGSAILYLVTATPV